MWLRLLGQSQPLHANGRYMSATRIDDSVDDAPVAPDVFSVSKLNRAPIKCGRSQRTLIKHRHM